MSLIRHAHSFVVRVETDRRVFTKTVAYSNGYGYPRVVALRPINRLRGLEVEVRLWQGAANNALVFYTLDRGQLVTMTGAPQSSSSLAGVWDLGGTIGTGSTEADCIPSRQVGLVKRWHYRGRWHYRAARYAVRATRFVRTGVYKLDSEQLISTLPRDWPQLKGLDFSSCGGVVARQ